MILLQGSGIHRDEHIAAVAGSVHSLADTHLKARHAAERALRGADFGRIVRKGRHLIAKAGRHIGKDVACELHSVAGVS